MNIKLYPSFLHGEIDAVSSKSYAHRILLSAMLCKEKTTVIMNGLCDDVSTTVNCIETLGGKVEKDGNEYTVTPIFGNLQNGVTFNCNDSASTLRFLIPITCALGLNATFTGSDKLSTRPIQPLTSVLDGCEFSSDFLPLFATGKLKGGIIHITGNISSQYISGLLFALPLLDKDSEIIIDTPIVSKPYIDITIDVLSKFGIKIIETNDGYRIKGNQTYVSPKSVTVEGDWSSASYFLTANVIGNIVRVKGLNQNSIQGDRAINKLALDFRCEGTVIDCTDIPDLVPCLAVIGAYSTSKTELKGIARLRIKESDRVSAIVSFLNNLGVKAEANIDTITITGNAGLDGGEVNSFNDHRIAMAVVIASTKANNPIILKNAECVSKSYPTFFEDYKKLGGKYDIV